MAITLSLKEMEQEEIVARFGALASRWRAETGMLSSSSARAMHPAYQQIIGMGPAALPLLLRELERAQEGWFWALKAISGEDPVPPDHRGKRAEMVSDWLQWGRNRGYIG